jgi:hypothetical protein
LNQVRRNWALALPTLDVGKEKNHSSSDFPFGINLLNTMGDNVTVMMATRMIAELTAGVMISCSKAIRDAAIISDNLADSSEPAANVSFQVKDNLNNSIGTILTTIAAAKRSGTSSNASFEEINSWTSKLTPTRIKKIGMKKENPNASKSLSTFLSGDVVSRDITTPAMNAPRIISAFKISANTMNETKIAKLARNFICEVACDKSSNNLRMVLLR